MACWSNLRRDFVNTLVHAARRGVVSRHGSVYTGWSSAGAEPSARSRRGRRDSRAARGRHAYVGQEHAVTVELPIELFSAQDRDGIKQRFDAVHETRYGYSAPGEKAEIVSLRSAITGLLRKPAFEPIATGDAEPPRAAFGGKRPVYFAEAGRHLDTPGYDRTRLVAGNRIAGPALIEEYASTTVLHPGDTVTVDAFGDLVIEILRS
jgi:N-methylhydantoinase A